MIGGYAGRSHEVQQSIPGADLNEYGLGIAQSAECIGEPHRCESVLAPALPDLLCVRVSRGRDARYECGFRVLKSEPVHQPDDCLVGRFQQRAVKSVRDVQHLMRHLGGGKQGTCGGQSVGGASQNGLIGGVVIGHPHRRDGLDERTQHRLLTPAGDHPSGRNICLDNRFPPPGGETHRMLIGQHSGGHGRREFADAVSEHHIRRDAGTGQVLGQSQLSDQQRGLAAIGTGQLHLGFRGELSRIHHVEQPRTVRRRDKTLDCRIHLGHSIFQ
ncbi:Uncharacterised protein [Mycobacteroides abscessus subsp. abscessus]|nr:Uncharacterised protein [Mycobacteroides abscessus subsp. abscessus]